jgi:filamentous hemagglutinin family protein
MLRKSSKEFGRFLLGAALLPSFVLCLSGAVFSEVTFDGSAVAHGRTDALSGPAYVIDADMGTQKGANLFHSFRLFNIATGEVALFTDTGATGAIQNIISRITGGSPSSIDGGIASIVPGANLYLVNPYGFIFGPNAWIDVPGSFHVTTADYLRMGDGAKFYADLGKTSVLSTEPVAAFGFLTPTPATISAEGSKLSSGYASTTISMIAGGIQMKGDPNNPTPYGGSSIVLPGGQVNLVAVASPGEVVVNQPGQTPSVDVGSFTAFGPITLSGNSIVDVSGPDTGELGAGTIIVRGGKLQITSSGLKAQTLGAVSANPVGIDIALTGDMLMEKGSYMYAQTGGYDGTGTGDGGAIVIKAGKLQMQEASTISAATVGAGRGGNITINVDNDLTLLPSSEISSNTVRGGTGGDIAVTARNVIVAGDQTSIDENRWTNISAQTFGSGQGGSITIGADSIQVLDAGFISTNLVPSVDPPTVASGQGGSIYVEAKDIKVSGMIIQNGTDVDFHSRIESRLMTPDATGSGGNISVTAQRLTLEGGGYIGSYLTYGSPGTAGNITVKTDTLTLNPQGKIESSSVLGTGTGATAGNIAVDANTITMVGVGSGSDERINFTGFRSDTLDGTGGNIGVRTDTLSMSKGAAIISDSSGAGTGGDIGITAGLVQLDQGAAISAKSSAAGYSGNIAVDANTITMVGVGSGSDERINFTGFRSDTLDGTGGNIGVRTDTLSMSKGAAIISDSSGAGTGGDIAINGGIVLLNGRALVSARSNGSGDAGNVALNVGSLTIDSATISTEARLADGGNISVNALGLVYLLDSQMTASVGGGESTVGGNITMNSSQIVHNRSGIIANAYEGRGGNIGITADVFLASLESVVSASSLLGIDGMVNVRAPVTSVSSTPAPVRGGYLQTADVLRDRCVARIQGGSQSSLTVSGRDGLPPRPGNVLPAPLF